MQSNNANQSNDRVVTDVQSTANSSGDSAPVPSSNIASVDPSNMAAQQTSAAIVPENISQNNSKRKAAAPKKRVNPVQAKKVVQPAPSENNTSAEQLGGGQQQQQPVSEQIDTSTTAQQQQFNRNLFTEVQRDIPAITATSGEEQKTIEQLQGNTGGQQQITSQSKGIKKTGRGLHDYFGYASRSGGRTQGDSGRQESDASILGTSHRQSTLLGNKLRWERRFK